MHVFMNDPLVLQQLNRKLSTHNAAVDGCLNMFSMHKQLYTRIDSLQIHAMSKKIIGIRTSDTDVILNASVPPIFHNLIFLNVEWAYHILYYWDVPGCQDALRITFGHEIAHAEDVRLAAKTRSQHCFVKRLNEILADFKGAEIAADKSKQALCNSMAYKIKQYYDFGKEDLLTQCEGCHPSWLQRKQYAERGTFDPSLILQIAADAEFHDTGFIEKAIDIYPTVTLL